MLRAAFAVLEVGRLVNLKAAPKRSGAEPATGSRTVQPDAATARPITPVAAAGKFSTNQTAGSNKISLRLIGVRFVSLLGVMARLLRLNNRG
jgi:hypothetical protein